MYKVACEYDNTAKYICDQKIEEFPEYPWKEINNSFINNAIYNMVRNSFVDLGLDTPNIGSKKWNPLGVYIKSGDTVVIKPNLVMHKNYRRGHKHNVECVYTSPYVVAPVIDYIVIALKHNGKIIIGDAPVQECDFNCLMEESGYAKLVFEYKNSGIDIEIKDFRGIKSISDYGVLKQSEVPNAKYKIIKLNEYSEFANIEAEKLKRLRITNYDSEELLKHHNSFAHEYCIADSILQANCIINMPKPKTHKKAGITACLKNMVGINCRKEYLPHHTIGSIYNGGDEYSRSSKVKESLTKTHDLFCMYVCKKKYLLARLFQCKQVILEYYLKLFAVDKTTFGSWMGNSTISRTIIDLNKIVIYADKDGVIQKEPQRRMFNVADMIISGQHNGPMAPTSRNVGIIIAGENPFAIDLVIAKLMRAKIEKIPTLQLLNSKCEDPLIDFNNNEEIFISSNDKRWSNITLNDFSVYNSFYFKPPSNWDDCFEK